MQGIIIVPKKLLPKESPSTPVSYEIAWHVDQPSFRLHIDAVKKSHKPHWSTLRGKETVFYMRSARLLATRSPSQIAMQDVAIVQQCLQSPKSTKEVKLYTTSALSFPLLSEDIGEHFLCKMMRSL